MVGAVRSDSKSMSKMIILNNVKFKGILIISLRVVTVKK